MFFLIALVPGHLIDASNSLLITFTSCLLSTPFNVSTSSAGTDATASRVDQIQFGSRVDRVLDISCVRGTLAEHDMNVGRRKMQRPGNGGSSEVRVIHPACGFARRHTFSLMRRLETGEACAEPRHESIESMRDLRQI